MNLDDKAIFYGWLNLAAGIVICGGSVFLSVTSTSSLDVFLMPIMFAGGLANFRLAMSNLSRERDIEKKARVDYCQVLGFVVSLALTAGAYVGIAGATHFVSKHFLALPLTIETFPAIPLVWFALFGFLATVIHGYRANIIERYLAEQS